MSTEFLGIPRQAVSSFEKNKNNKQFYKDTARAILNMSNQRFSARRIQLQKLYDAANGKINSEDYDSLINIGRFGGNDKFPAKVRNYPIIPPVINRLLGDKRVKGLNMVASVLNDDAKPMFLEAEKQKKLDYLFQAAINKLNSYQFETGVPSKNLEPPTDYIKKFSGSYRDIRAELAEDIINYHQQTDDLEEKYVEGYYHWLVSGEVYSERFVSGKRVETIIHNPLDIDFELSPNKRFIEDSDWAMVRQWGYASDVIDFYHEHLSYDDVVRIENPRNNNASFTTPFFQTNQVIPDTLRLNRLVEHIRVYWKTRIKSYNVTYFDVFGQKTFEKFDESFNFTKFKLTLLKAHIEQLFKQKQFELESSIKEALNAKLEELSSELSPEELQQIEGQIQQEFVMLLGQEAGKIQISKEELIAYSKYVEETTLIEEFWINEVAQATIIDNDVFINLGVCPIQRYDLDNPSICKLPINGRIYSNINSTNISLVSLGIPFQINYNIFKYRLELAVAKSRDIVAVFDINMLPKEWGKEAMNKFMYYLQGMGIAWVDYNKEGIKVSSTMQSVLDLSIKTITQYVELINMVSEEWERVSGVSRQRMSEIKASDGLGTVNQAIANSSLITEDLSAKFEKFEEKDFNALLDFAKVAFLDGKKASYVLPDGAIKMFEVLPNEIADINWGIKIISSYKEQAKINEMKQLAYRVASQNTPLSVLAEVIDATSFNKMKRLLNEIDFNNAEMAKQENELKREIEALKNQIKEKELQYKYDALNNEAIQKQLDRDNDVLLKQMDIEANANPITIEDTNNIQQEDAKRAVEITKAFDGLMTNASQQEREDNKLELEKKKINLDTILAKIKVENESRKLDIEEKKLELEDKKIETDYKIAKENRNKYDK